MTSDRWSLCEFFPRLQDQLVLGGSPLLVFCKEPSFANSKDERSALFCVRRRLRLTPRSVGESTHPPVLPVNSRPFALRIPTYTPVLSSPYPRLSQSSQYLRRTQRCYSWKTLALRLSPGFTRCLMKTVFGDRKEHVWTREGPPIHAILGY